MTFDKKALDGTIITADELARVTGANLNRQFASVVSTSDVLAGVGVPGRDGGGR